MSKMDTTRERMQSACRLRQIRENTGFTQEQFAEILGISVSAYKKVESGENQVSLSCLRNLYNELHVSADYVLFGKKQEEDEVWKAILNCTEADKMLILVRLLVYFTKVKKESFPLREECSKEEEAILHLMQNLQDNGIFYDTKDTDS